MLTPDTLLLRRRAANITQGQLATRLGVHRRTIVNWERGRFAIPADLDERLLAALAVPVAPTEQKPLGRPPKRPHWMPEFPKHHAAFETPDPWGSWEELKLWCYASAVMRIRGRGEYPTPESLRAEFSDFVAELAHNDGRGMCYARWEREKSDFTHNIWGFSEKRQTLITWMQDNGMADDLRS
jgi:transcriptional regulator with XRE-family HTH domain